LPFGMLMGQPSLKCCRGYWCHKPAVNLLEVVGRCWQFSVKFVNWVSKGTGNPVKNSSEGSGNFQKALNS
jgi:hypothetical protein